MAPICEMLAIHNSWLGRGYGLALKAALIEHALISHAVAVTFHVDRDNAGMLRINRRLNAAISPHPNDPGVMLCVIPLASRSDPCRTIGERLRICLVRRGAPAASVVEALASGEPVMVTPARGA